MLSLLEAILIWKLFTDFFVRHLIIKNEELYKDILLHPIITSAKAPGTLTKIELNDLLRVGETREDGEVVLVEVLELRAREGGDRAGENVGEWLKGLAEGRLKTLELVDTAGLSSLEGEASKVVALEEVGAVKDTASNIAQVNTSLFNVLAG